MPISSLVLEILNIHHILGAKRSLVLEILNTYYKYNVSQKELILEENIHYYNRFGGKTHCLSARLARATRRHLKSKSHIVPGS